MRRIFTITLLLSLLLPSGILLPTVNGQGWSGTVPLRNQISPEERRKRELFLKARERMVTLPAATPTPTRQETPRPTPAPQATPEPAPTPEPAQTPRATPRHTATPRVTPRPTATPRATPRPTASPRATPESAPEVTPTPRSKRTPKPKPTPKAKRTPKPKPTPRERAPVVVQKSGHLEEQGYEPPPRSRGWFGGGPRYKYLSKSVRDQIDGAKVRRGRWKYVIIHNSGTRQGNAKIFGYYHKNVRKMSNGLAYHFVIGNGNSSGNGEIEIGSRWTRQINGGHVASDYLNNIAIGICLVGDFNRDQPTKAQIDALGELTTYLRRRVGRIEGRHSIVKAHKQINPKPTDCPGNRFPYDWLKKNFD